MFPSLLFWERGGGGVKDSAIPQFGGLDWRFGICTPVPFDTKFWEATLNQTKPPTRGKLPRRGGGGQRHRILPWEDLALERQMRTLLDPPALPSAMILRGARQVTRISRFSRRTRGPRWLRGNAGWVAHFGVEMPSFSGFHRWLILLKKDLICTPLPVALAKFVIPLFVGFEGERFVYCIFLAQEHEGARPQEGCWSFKANSLGQVS